MASRAVIVGFDPGSTRSGYGVIDVGGTEAQPVMTFLAMGDVESTGSAIDAFFARCDPFNTAAGKIVGVEKTEGVVYGLKGAGIVPNLISCARADATICENARHRGVQVVELTAKRWRQCVCGKNNANDGEVKVCVSRLIRGLPTRSNVHERDALGVAIAIALGMRK